MLQVKEGSVCTAQGTKDEYGKGLSSGEEEGLDYQTLKGSKMEEERQVHHMMGEGGRYGKS